MTEAQKETLQHSDLTAIIHEHKYGTDVYVVRGMDETLTDIPFNVDDLDDAHFEYMNAHVMHENLERGRGEMITVLHNVPLIDLNKVGQMSQLPLGVTINRSIYGYGSPPHILSIMEAERALIEEAVEAPPIYDEAALDMALVTLVDAGYDESIAEKVVALWRVSVEGQ